MKGHPSQFAHLREAGLTYPFISGCLSLHPEKESGDFIAEDFQDQWCELHAVLRLEGEAAVLFGVLLVEAPQIRQLLDHLGIEQATARGRMLALDVALQDVGEAVLKGLH